MTAEDTSGWDDPGADGSTGVGRDGHGQDPGDRLPEPARRAYTALLTNRYIARARNRAAWEGLLAYEHEIRARLDEIFLDLEVDRDAEVAFKRQQDGEDVPRLLKRDKALTRDASFVLLFLRRECAFTDPTDGPVVLSREQISEFLRAFRQEGDLDEARFARRVDAAINALVQPLRLLTPDPAVEYLFTVSPVVVPLVGPDEVQRLEAAYRDATGTATGTTTGNGETSAGQPDDARDEPQERQ